MARKQAKKPAAPAATAEPEPVVMSGQIAALAYAMWQERGCPEGTPEEDWFRAEGELREAGTMSRPPEPA